MIESEEHKRHAAHQNFSQYYLYVHIIGRMVIQTALRRTLVPSVHAVRYCGARGSAVHTLALRAPLAVREAHRLCTAHFVVHNIDEPQSSSQYIISHVGALGYR